MISKQNILATLAYYDVFDFPLKAGEIFTKMVKFDHLGNCQLPIANYQLFQEELNRLVLDEVVNRVGNYYFLFDREYLVPLRLKHEKIAEYKWRIAKRAIRRLRFVPYVQAVFASGSLAMSNTDELSDLDVLIVVRHGRIWLTRLLITAILSILRIRRRGHDKIAPDKICLNHYISDRALLIPYQSIYNAQTYANLIPIYIRDAGLIEKFTKSNNWVLDYVASWNTTSVEVSVEVKPPRHPMFGSSTSKHWVEAAERILDRLGIAGILEKWLGRYQSRRIARNPATYQTGGRVIFTDEQLEFHPHSIETQIIKSYNERLIKIGLPQLAIEKDSGLFPTP